MAKKGVLTLSKPVYPDYLNTLVDACTCIGGEAGGEIGGSRKERKFRTLEDRHHGDRDGVIPS